MLSEVKFTLNGKKIVYQGDPLRRLLDVIREDLGQVRRAALKVNAEPAP